MEVNLQIIRNMFNYLNIQNTEFENHSVGVANLSYRICDNLKIDGNIKKLIYYSALLHDIGQVAISEDLLTKSEKLTFEEMELIKTHVEKTITILKSMEVDKNIITVVQPHHERLTGTGYPDGITDISLETRILIVADVIDAMMRNKPYREKRSLSYVGDVLLKSEDFDKNIARIALSILESDPYCFKNPLVYEF